MTTVLNAWSIAYPDITNRLKAVIYKQSDPLAEVASIIDNTAGHPARKWHFPGLDRTNYNFKLLEIDGGGLTVNVLANFDVVPGEIDGSLTRAEEQITEGVTAGFVGNTTGFTFDGTDGKPDWRGWEINVEVTGGSGTMVKEVQYTWNKLTGEFALQEVGNVIAPGAVWDVRFDAQDVEIPDSAPTNSDMPILYLDVDTELTAADFGKKLIAEPAGNYMEITCPDIATIVEGRFLDVDIVAGVAVKCVKFKTKDGQPIAWLQLPRTSFYAHNNESFRIYKFNRPGQAEFRVTLPFGNFAKVGMSVHCDMDSDTVINAVLADGTPLDIYQYARLYNEFVLQLPMDQICNFDDWTTGDNKYKYSLANSTNPIYADKFRIPDRRDIVVKNSSAARKPSTIQADALKEHFHFTFSGTQDGNNPPIPTHWVVSGFADGGNLGYSMRRSAVEATAGKTSRVGVGNAENLIKTFSNHEYILI